MIKEMLYNRSKGTRNRLKQVMKMKKELDDYLYELTMNLKAGSDERFSAYQIAESLQLNRSTISSYLNQAFRDGELVKIKIGRAHV